MKYKLAKSGFMRNFEGSWEIAPHKFLSPTSKDGVEGTASMVGRWLLSSQLFALGSPVISQQYVGFSDLASSVFLAF